MSKKIIKLSFYVLCLTQWPNFFRIWVVNALLGQVPVALVYVDRLGDSECARMCVCVFCHEVSFTSSAIIALKPHTPAHTKTHTQSLISDIKPLVQPSEVFDE